MLIHLRFGIVAAVCAFLIASAVPADAQRGHGSGSGPPGGAGAAPRPSPGPGPSAGARPPQGPSPGGGGRPATGPVYRPGPGYRPSYGSRGYYPANGYRGYYPGYGYRGYYPGYGYRGYYPGYYSGFAFGVGAYGWPYYYRAWPYAAYGYYGGSFDSGYGAGSGGASLKVEVQPKTAEVYVDGQLAGTVDQFDGMFQSLSVEPGGHEITIYHEGFRTIRQQLYLNEGSTQRIKGAMAQLAPGEPNEPRPQPAQGQPERQYQVAPQYSSPRPQGPPPDRPAPDSNPPLPGSSRFGQVAIRVQPADAEVLINGEPWRNPDGAERLLVYLSPGTHRVEIRKDGYDGFVTAVEIKRGEVTPLNVSLAKF